MLCSVMQVTIDRRRFLKASGAAFASVQLLGCSREKIPARGIPISQYHEESTAEEVTAGLDLRGKVAVVTGCTSGIGFETMRVLAGRGAQVIGTSRSLQRAEEACRRVDGDTVPVELDLGDFGSVVACSEAVLNLELPIDMLICNAGYLGGGNKRQLIGQLEKHFVINHLGHFVLVDRLLDRLASTTEARVVTVASQAAYTDAPNIGILFDDLDFSYDYKDLLAYGHSKLANVLFSLQLAEQLRGTGITSNSLHPGIVDTEIDRHFNSFMQFGLKMVAALGGKTIEQAAATTCYVATSDIIQGVSGAFFEDCNAVTVSGNHHLYNADMAARLFEISRQLTADYLVDRSVTSDGVGRSG
jgi:NAD(P)-dependent dehydrogenase (short-subunit alcohol dehydrogenase family)